MTTKQLSGDCENCESTYTISFMEEMVSQDLPEHCPFCGEIIEELSEEFAEEDEDLGNTDWD